MPMFLLSCPYLGDWDHASGLNALLVTLGQKNIGLIRQETYKNEDASLVTCIIPLSPIPGAQDVSLTPFTHTPSTHTLSLPDPARRSACTLLFKPVRFQNSFSWFVLRCGSSYTQAHRTGISTVVAFALTSGSSAMSFMISLPPAQAP
jgi:hypothetical protein